MRPGSNPGAACPFRRRAGAGRHRAMLTALRRLAGTWVAKILFALLVLSFAIWGIEDVVRNFLDDMNPDSVRSICAQLEPALKDAQAEDRYQFERHGYFVADRVDSQAGTPVFNRTVTLKDSWSAQ